MNNGCEPCGASGQPCCYQNVGGEFCTGGNGCESFDGPGTCSKECGAIGKPCCEGEECDNGSTCNVNEVCEGFANDPCFSGSTPHTFTVVLADCGFVTQTYWTETMAEAEACREQWLPVGAGEELCPADVAPDESHVCKDGESFGFTFFHCSAEQLAACETNFCSNCAWGACP